MRLDRGASKDDRKYRGLPKEQTDLYWKKFSVRSKADVAEAQGDDEGGTLIARKVGEAVQNTLGAVVTAIDIPLGLVKDAARPAYWVPDHEILHCHNCRKEFSIKLSKHHCRACGQGFCDECSHDRRAVPSRGWDHPVRVCFNCNKKPGDL